MKFKTEEKKVSVNEEPEVRYAYVVFKNMDGKDENESHEFGIQIKKGLKA